MRKMTWLAVMLLSVLACGTLQAEEVDVKTLPGYVNLEDIKIPGETGKVTEISLGPGLLKLARESADNGDEELTRVLSNLKCIQVKAFEVNQRDRGKIRTAMKLIEARLEKEGWERAVSVKSEDEFVVVSLKQRNGRAVGLLVMALEEDGEAVFANIVGDFELEDLGDIDEMIDLGIKVEVEDEDE
ncbi:MAG: DUF4252 domain-containing protein [Candidatus Eiseniibacteriota bacterium]|nr:MAG: DUF4252 domain-containing protein [Candidatus Eisenbacteria bacterium]